MNISSSINFKVLFTPICLLHCHVICQVSQDTIYRVSHKKGIEKKLSVRAHAHDISVSFVWCIILKVWTDQGKVTAVFWRCTCFLGCKFSRKQLSNFRNASVSHFFRNLSLTIIWINLGLSYYKHMKRNFEVRKKVF